MTADLLHTTSELWDHAPVVEAIAAGPDWQEKVRAFWAITSPEAHSLSHPLGGVYRCPGCGPVRCPSCGLPESVCEDPSGHDRLVREGETSLLIGTATYGKAAAGC